MASLASMAGILSILLFCSWTLYAPPKAPKLGFRSSSHPLSLSLAEWLVFEGISVDESGRQHYLDASIAYKRAVLNAIDYLSRFGYSKEQVNSAAILPRVASLVHRLLIEAESKHAGISVALVLPLWGKDLGNRRQPECCCHPRHSHCHIRSGDLCHFISDPCSSPNDDDDEDDANRISDRRRGRCPPVLESWRGTPMSSTESWWKEESNETKIK